MPPPQEQRKTTEQLTILADVPRELGCYRLSGVLGRGGMGEVWQAFDQQLERDVAIKLMRKELLADEEAVKRFQREARAVARLNHPNIVQVYSFGEQHGLVYFAMEMVEGESLTQRLKRMGALSLEESVYILLQTIEGLSYANARGIIHRDIKPANLMLTPDFRVKVTDFGLAKMIEHDSHMTATGVSMGSPHYMSPEQARGQEADHRSDIYALGITFYQMLTNKLPFTADLPISVLLKHIQDPLPEPDELKRLVNGEVMDVNKRMTAKDPDARFQTYGGLAAAIAKLAPDVQVRSSTFSKTASMPAPGENAIPSAGASTLTIPAGARVSAAEDEESHAPKEEVASRPPAEEFPATPTSSVVRARRRFAAATILGIAAVFMAIAAATLAVLAYLREPAARAVTPVAQKTAQARTTEGRGEVDSDAVVRPTAITSDLPETARSDASPESVPGTNQGDVARLQPTLQEQSIPIHGAPLVIATPHQVHTIRQLIIGPEDAIPGIPIPIFNAENNQVGTLPAGTRVQASGIDQTHGSRYRIAYDGNEYYVRAEEGRYDYSSESGPANADAAATVQTVMIVGADEHSLEPIPVYANEATTRELPQKLPIGTQLTLVREHSTTYQVLLPNGRSGFIYKQNGRLED